MLILGHLWYKLHAFYFFILNTGYIKLHTKPIMHSHRYFCNFSALQGSDIIKSCLSYKWYFSIYFFLHLLLFYFCHMCCIIILFWCFSRCDIWWRSCQALSWIKGSIRQTYVLTAFVLVAFFIWVKYNFFISLHSEWQFLKIAPHQRIFITFCRPAWVARQLFIFLHLSSISLSESLFFFLSLAVFLLYFAMTFLFKLLGLCYSQFENCRE